MSKTLENDLQKIRTKSKALREEGLRIKQSGNLSESQKRRLEVIRKEINDCRSRERFVSGQIKKLRS